MLVFNWFTVIWMLRSFLVVPVLLGLGARSSYSFGGVALFVSFLLGPKFHSKDTILFAGPSPAVVLKVAAAANAGQSPSRRPGPRPDHPRPGHCRSGGHPGGARALGCKVSDAAPKGKLGVEHGTLSLAKTTAKDCTAGQQSRFVWVRGFCSVPMLPPVNPAGERRSRRKHCPEHWLQPGVQRQDGLQPRHSDGHSRLAGALGSCVSALSICMSADQDRAALTEKTGSTHR
ncbi:hypothetical protein LZ30DRAFT_802232 [Colletotrichum cereale]|nr:hypothetical protein LZ30DRAFT_802232 [Colletotrichum cereale]